MSERDAILAHVYGPLRVLAGAGSGKTRVMVDKLIGLIRDGHAEPGQILALTFTNKAAEEMGDRVRAALAADPLVRERPDLDELTVQTFHAFASGLLREFGITIGIEADAQVISRAKTWQMMLDVMDEVTFEHLTIPPTRIGPNFIDLLVELSNGLADHVASIDEFERHLLTRLDRSDVSDGYRETLRKALEIVPVLRTYHERKRKHNMVDYADQISLVVRLLERAELVCAALREQYRFVLVDEYQDTNVAQRRLLQMLALDPATRAAGNITVVGDNDQSIYAFRGATVENILHFERDFLGASSLPLTVNHRSGPEILACADAIIGKIPPHRRPPKGLTPAPGSSSARVEYFVAADGATEAEHIARLIAEAKPWADTAPDSKARGWRSFGVLAATNRDLAPVASALRSAGIPVEILGTGGFFTRPEMVDVLAILRAVADPSNNVAIMRMLKGPRYRVGDRDLVWVARASTRIGKARAAREFGLSWEDDHGYRLIDGIEQIPRVENVSDEAARRLVRFRTELRELIRLGNRLPLVDFVASVIEWSGVATECAASPAPAAREAERSIARLRDLAQGFQPLSGSGNLRAFLEYLEFAEDTDDEDDVVVSSDDAVRLVTIHRAKGLEFPCVFLCAMEGRWPFQGRPRDETREWHVVPHALRGDREYLPVWDGDDGAFHEALQTYELEEHRRIAYVGLTRAKRRLVISRAHWYGDRKSVSKPAQFWTELVETRIPHRLFEEAAPPENPGRLIADAPGDAAVPEWDWRPHALDPSFDPLGPLTPAEAEAVRVRVDALTAEVRSLAELEAAARRPPAREPDVPKEMSVSALLDRLTDERLFHERHVLGLPEPVSWRARRGTAVHEWIEEQAWARTDAALLPEIPGAGPESLLPEDIHIDTGDDAPDEGDERGDGAGVQALQRAFLETPYASLTPKYVEWPFSLRVSADLTVRGRIDAIYEHSDGTLEIVDWKTGEVDASSLQLAVYERAVREILKPPAVRSVFVGLRDGRIIPGRGELDLSSLDVEP